MVIILLYLKQVGEQNRFLYSYLNNSIMFKHSKMKMYNNL